jgi:hypothetical protein
MAEERTSPQIEAQPTAPEGAVRVYEYLMPPEAARGVLPVLPVPLTAPLVLVRRGWPAPPPVPRRPSVRRVLWPGGR